MIAPFIPSGAWSSRVLGENGRFEGDAKSMVWFGPIAAVAISVAPASTVTVPLPARGLASVSCCSPSVRSATASIVPSLTIAPPPEADNVPLPLSTPPLLDRDSAAAEVAAETSDAAVQDFERAADSKACRAIGGGRQRCEQREIGADFQIAGDSLRVLHAADEQHALVGQQLRDIGDRGAVDVAGRARGGRRGDCRGNLNADGAHGGVPAAVHHRDLHDVPARLQRIGETREHCVDLGSGPDKLSVGPLIDPPAMPNGSVTPSVPPFVEVSVTL